MLEISVSLITGATFNFHWRKMQYEWKNLQKYSLQCTTCSENCDFVELSLRSAEGTNGFKGTYFLTNFYFSLIFFRFDGKKFNFNVRMKQNGKYQTIINVPEVDVCNAINNLDKHPMLINGFNWLNLTFPGLFHQCPYKVILFLMLWKTC